MSPPSPAQLGFRMPAEFEPQDRVWVATPTNPDTWPGRLEQAQAQHAAWCDAMRKVVEVKTVQSIGPQPEDAWVRDYGPVFLTNAQGELAFNDFIFNAWGEKYPPWKIMNTVPERVGEFLSQERNETIQRFAHDMVLEGGSFAVNGKGTLLTTESCLLHPSRNPTLSREQIEQKLADALGITHVVWLPAGIEGDDTDGHLDDVAQWLTADTVCCVRPSPDHHEHAALQANGTALQNARDQQGQPLNLVALPAVDPPLVAGFLENPGTPGTPGSPGTPEKTFGASGGDRLPASYANFLIVNGSLFLPIFNRPTDDVAIRALEQAAPHLSVIPLRADHLVVGLGAFHCLSQQQPTPPTPPICL